MLCSFTFWSAATSRKLNGCRNSPWTCARASAAARQVNVEVNTARRLFLRLCATRLRNACSRQWWLAVTRRRPVWPPSASPTRTIPLATCCECKAPLPHPFLYMLTWFLAQVACRRQARAVRWLQVRFVWGSSGTIADLVLASRFAVYVFFLAYKRALFAGSSRSSRIRSSSRCVSPHDVCRLLCALRLTLGRIFL